MDNQPDDMSIQDASNNKSTTQVIPDLELQGKPTPKSASKTADTSFKDPLADDAQRHSNKSFDEMLNRSIYETPASSLTERVSHPMVNSNRRSDDISAKMEKELIAYNHLTYLIYMISFFTAGLTWIIPIVMNYLRRGDAEYSWLATHFDWQIKTFWYSVIVGFIGIVLIVVGGGGSIASLVTMIFAESGATVFGGSIAMMLLGGFIILIAYLWHLYRLIKGWIALSAKRAV